MLNKKIDLRVEILSYLNENNKIEYYPRCGFPFEIFIISENMSINLFTKENLNSSNYIFFIKNNCIDDIAITLKKLLFIGSYCLYDHFSWNYLNNFLIDSNKKIVKKTLLISNIFLSLFLDIKIIQIHYYTKQISIKTLTNIFQNAIWLERENSEMFNINYLFLKDTRKLLLDYTNTRGIMLKNTNNINFTYYYKNYYNVNYIEM